VKAALGLLLGEHSWGCEASWCMCSVPTRGGTVLGVAAGLYLAGGAFG
jgi:hypothetical protein